MTDYADLERRLREGDLTRLNETADAISALTKHVEEAREVGSVLLEYLESEYTVRSPERADGSHIAENARADWLRANAVFRSSDISTASDAENSGSELLRDELKQGVADAAAKPE